MLKKHTEKIEIPRTVLDKARIAIVRAQFNGQLTESLEKHCLAALLEHGVKKDQILQFQVPGSLEIPIIAQNIAKAKKANIIIALGVVIKGDTYHFEIVANECARGCMDVALKYNVPIIFEVIPVYNLAQAKKRAGNNNQNKGREAALAALKMLNVMSNFARK
ncbi:6,7-dimethyl-8-ribityllumazine synthase [Candidatus Curtissbacteria bacterium RIFCSPHIGHO2_02_FULL_42_15]|uniref:6,7-dimethyl-8-ribityllumazine synthase n=1 Tax=Candidatus Curtissbacteria bacterium RIFCSPHIGHO2_02_FULL_42_15 TaxID=1797716 RepID=A0A1F5GEW1_9BACT|nr:MAG: 6,7-dimethyl-8-ribityllumazine synthase [Candidatus Curtissbacteria bacterium RIFCSPHIGHO2_02_FULL_42_15]